MSLLLVLQLGVAAAAVSYGVNVHTQPDDVYDMVKAANISWVRIDVNWFEVEPSEGVFDWSGIDANLALARSRQIFVFATFAYTPAWAAVQGNGPGAVPRAGAYDAALAVAVARYCGQIDHWGVWNEPNIGQFWNGTAAQYVELIGMPGVAAIHQSCATAMAHGPELANVGKDLNDWYAAVLPTVGNAVDVIDHHIYQSFPQIDPGAGLTSDSFENALLARRPLSDRLALREALDKYHVPAHKEVWITETGYRCQPPTDAEEEAKQARYYELALELQQQKAPWWTNTFFYEILDCGPQCPIDGFGMLRRADNGTTLTAKPSFAAYQSWIREHPAGTDAR
jgi:hypothetical protein